MTFAARLTGAVLVAPTDSLPAFNSPKPRQAEPVAVPPPPQGPPAPSPPADFWQTDIARELQADRGQIEAVLTRVRSAVDKHREDQAARLDQWQRAAVDLAVTVAARLLHQRVEAGEFPTEAKVRDMADQLGSEPLLAVYLNPNDLALLESRLGGAPLLPGRGDPRVVPDSTLARGACRVEGKESMLISDVAAELGGIRDELLRSLGHARP